MRLQSSLNGGSNLLSVPTGQDKDLIFNHKGDVYQKDAFLFFQI